MSEPHSRTSREEVNGWLHRLCGMEVLWWVTLFDFGAPSDSCRKIVLGTLLNIVPRTMFQICSTKIWPRLPAAPQKGGPSVAAHLSVPCVVKILFKSCPGNNMSNFVKYFETLQDVFFHDLPRVLPKTRFWICLQLFEFRGGPSESININCFSHTCPESIKNVCRSRPTAICR